jgi:hypothetical protein
MNEERVRYVECKTFSDHKCRVRATAHDVGIVGNSMHHGSRKCDAVEGMKGAHIVASCPIRCKVHDISMDGGTVGCHWKDVKWVFNPDANKFNPSE